MISDYFKLALKNLKKRRLRSLLTIIGIFISIAIIFILISLSLGLQDAIEEQFRALGTDKFFVMPQGQLAGPGSGGAVELTMDDVNALEKVTGVKGVSYATAGNVVAEFKGEKRYLMTVGIPLDQAEIFEEVSAYKAEEGRLLQEDDSEVVMLGSQFKDRVFSREISSGDTIAVNSQEFKVRAVLASLGNPSDDRLIYMSFDDFKSLFNNTERIDQIIVQVNPEQNITEVAERAAKKLRSSRGVTEDTQDFYILTPEELLSSFGVILNIATAFLVGVAAISLLVGSIGIANTMYTSVLERRREIGVMKAVGAKNSDILLIFLIESGLLGLVGGVIGVLLGIVVSKSLEYYAVTQLSTNLLQAALPAYLIIGCVAFAFVIGAVSGIWPAWQATRIKPTEALRYE